MKSNKPALEERVKLAAIAIINEIACLGDNDPDDQRHKAMRQVLSYSIPARSYKSVMDLVHEYKDVVREIVHGIGHEMVPVYDVLDLALNITPDLDANTVKDAVCVHPDIASGYYPGGEKGAGLEYVVRRQQPISQQKNSI